MKKMVVTLIALTLLLETAAATAYAGASIQANTHIGNVGLVSRVALDHSDEDDRGWRAPVIEQLSPAHGAQQLGQLEVLKWVFSENVNKGKGNIILRDSTGKVIEQTSVTSRRISINGRQVEWELRDPLSKGTTYNVQIDYGTFEGEQGEFVGSDSSIWSFSTAADQVVPQLVKLTPSVGEKLVATDANLTIQFTEEVGRNNGEITILNVTRNVVEERIAANSKQITGEGTKTITINPNMTFRNGEEYLITISQGAFIDRDRLAYVGLTTNDNWRFTAKPAAGDVTAPLLQQVQIEGTKILKLMYNEKLNESSIPPIGSFSVLVNGDQRPLKSISITGNTVKVELTSGIAAGQILLLGYTAQNGQRVIEDAARNAASNFGNYVVDNRIENSVPKVTDATFSGTRVTLQLNEKLDTVSSSAWNQFVVSVDGSSKGIRRIEHNGAQVSLILDDSLAANRIVQVSYTPGANPLKDEMGNPLQKFQNQYVRAANDSTAPVYQSAKVKGKLLTIQYNEPLHPDKLPQRSHYSVLVNQKARYVDKVEVKNDQVVLTLNAAVSLNDLVSLSYVPGDPRLSDLAGNGAASISLAAVANSSDNVAPVLKQATVKGSVVTLQFSEKVRVNSNTPFGMFYVYADSTLRTINGSSLNGDTVTLVLDAPITSFSEVKVTYAPGNNPIQDDSANNVAMFVNEPVSNQSDASSGRPADLKEVPYEWFLEDGMYVMSTAGASTTTEMLKDQRYRLFKLPETKLKESFRFASRSNNSKHLVVEVPTGENVGKVEVPLSALEEMRKEAVNGKLSIRYGQILYTLLLADLDIPKLKRDYENKPNASIYIVFTIHQARYSSVSMDVDASSVKEPYYISLASYAGDSSTSKLLDSAYEVRVNITGTPFQISKKDVTLLKYDLGTRNLVYLPNTLRQYDNKSVLKFNGAKDMYFGAYQASSYIIDIDTHWARSAIGVFANKFIIDLAPNNRYGPNVEITRGEFASLLARAFGLESDESAAHRFKDLSFSHPLAPWIGAATEAGIINGYSDNTFKPNSKITREQMAVMIIRAMEMIDTSIEYDSTVLTKFKDRGKISGYAREAVIQAISSGLLNGVTAQTFDPSGNATRAQAVVMVQRLLTSIDYLTK